MNTKQIYVYIRAWRYFCLAMTLFFVGLESTHAQTFRLRDRDYKEVEGRWYTHFSGKIGDEIIPERIVLQLKPGLSIPHLNLAQRNLADLQVLTGPFAENFYVLKVPANLAPFVSATALAALSDIRDLEFDALGEWTGTPDDPQWPNQWNLQAAKLNMPPAWDISTGSYSVLLAIIDTGFEYNHEDLAANIWSAVGWDFHDDDADPLPDYTLNQDHHGTAVAGIAAAVTDNGKGVAGIAGGWYPAQGVKIMCLRPDFWVDEYNDQRPFQASVADAVTYAYENGARVINLSLAYTSGHAALTSAINTAVNDHDCVVVCSSGNKGGVDDGGVGGDYWYVRYPAWLSNTIAVGATEQDDTRWITGTTQGSSYGPELDLMAPQAIWTTDLIGSEGKTSGNYYSGFGGTSAAAPHVAGLAALIRSHKPGYGWQQVEDVMTGTADKVGGVTYNSNGWHQEYGHGRIDAYAALSSILTVSISGPPSLGYKQSGTFTANVSGGSGTIYYQWYKQYDGSSNWLTRGTSQSQFETMFSTSFTMKVVVTRGGQQDQATRYCVYESEQGGPLPKRVPGPQAYALHPNSPNPFNPATTVRYDLPEQSRVSLTIYDMMGRQVWQHTAIEAAGYKAMTWAGKDESGQRIPTGIYIYRLAAIPLDGGEPFVASHKVVLLK